MLVHLRRPNFRGTHFCQLADGRLMKTVGHAYGPGGPLSGVKAYSGIVVDATTIQINFTQCVSVPGPGYLGIEYSIDGGAWTAVTGATKITDAQWNFTTGTITAGDEVRWRYVGGSDTIVDCDEAADIGEQGPLTLDNALVLEGDFMLMETGGADIVLLEDDPDGTNGVQLESAPNELLVGTSGFLFGFRPARHPTSQFGDLTPDTIAGIPVYQLTTNSSNDIIVLDLGLAGGEQIPGVSTITIDHPDGQASLIWSGTRYEAVDAVFSARIQADIGQTMTLII